MRFDLNLLLSEMLNSTGIFMLSLQGMCINPGLLQKQGLVIDA